MAESMESWLVVDALHTALAQLMPEGLLAHSDRGSQYASDHYQRVLGNNGIQCSMSRAGNCFDNAPMESFVASLKVELGVEVFASRDQARARVFEYLEVFYNRVRRHSSLGYVALAEFESADSLSTACPFFVGNSKSDEV